MTWNYESELTQKFELLAEQYWIEGMSLSDARTRALNEVVENRTEEAPIIVPIQA